MSDRAPIDIGHGITVTLRDCECSGFVHDHSIPCGLTWRHSKPDGFDCDASPALWVPLGHVQDFANWKLEQLEPLTISPSLLCRHCGTHGFIRQGKWVPA